MKKADTNQYKCDTRKGDENMVMEKTSIQPLDVDFILTHGKAISSQEAIADIAPIEWDEDVLNGDYKGKVIIKSKCEEEK